VTDRYQADPAVQLIESPTAVANGTVPTTPEMSGGDDPSKAFTSDCPLTGTVLK